MVNNSNLINLINNKKPVELVQELKDEYKTLSFEEFMESYENDSNLNYDDLSGSDIGIQKVYRPCNTCGNTRLRFKLVIELRNCIGNGKHGEVYSTKEAERAAREIEEERGF